MIGFRGLIGLLGFDGLPGLLGFRTLCGSSGLLRSFWGLLALAGFDGSLKCHGQPEEGGFSAQGLAGSAVADADTARDAHMLRNATAVAFAMTARELLPDFIFALNSSCSLINRV